MKAAKAKPAWFTPGVLRHLKRVEYDFHVRAFGEEMARVNFLPLPNAAATSRRWWITRSARA
jgi:hypothetical protein